MRSSLLLLSLLASSLAFSATPKVEALGPLAGKLDDRLIPAVRALDDGSGSDSQLAGGVQSALAGVIAPPPPGTRVLPFILDVPLLNDALLTVIAQTGVNITYSSPRWHSVSVQATIAQAAALAQLPGVRSVKLAVRNVRHAQPGSPGQGSAYNQADATLHADIARNATGLSGAGQKIGVLSDSFNDGVKVGPGTRAPGPTGSTTVTGTIPQQTGDLPAAVQIVDFGPGAGTDEGEGMMELIHDIAPNAALAFASGNTDLPSYADNITKLRQAGCTITCDDLFYFNEPCFQDGPVSQAINASADAGVPHFSSAGNEASNGVLATYSPVNPANSADNSLATPDGQDFHAFNLPNTPAGFIPIDVPSGRDITVMLQWNQPYASFNLGPGSSVDMDLLLYDAPDAVNGHLIAAGGDSQFVNNMPSGDPFEIFQYINQTGAQQRVYLAVNHYSGSRVNTVFRLVFLNAWNGLAFPSGGVNDMSIFGHSGCAKGISVGAIFYAEIDSGGLFSLDTTHINAERYTSKGGYGVNGVPYYFDATGNPLPNAPVRVNKPDITACDGGNTSVFGSDLSIVLGGVTYDTDSFPNFFGTSAAAPNAAAIAALMLERAPLSTPAQINSALQATAHDIISDIPLSVLGPDDITGAGWIDAAGAVGAVPGILLNPLAVTIDPGHDASFTVIAVGASTLNYQWQRNAKNIPGATGSTLPLQALTAADDGGLFRCVVSNSYGTVVSQTALLSVNPLPRITLQPQNQAVNPDTTVLFALLAVNGTLTYQWQRNNADIPGAIFSSYALVGTAATDDGVQFRCVVTNSAGSTISSNAMLTVNPVPKIAVQPQNATVAQGSTFSFSVEAFNGILSYQWLRNGGEIPGAIGASYSGPPAVPGDSGAVFQCVVTNGAGSVLSSSAALTVLLAPVIIQQPANVFVAPGTGAAFSVQAVNGVLKYQWRRNGVDLPGETFAIYAIGKTTSADSGAQFTCRVSNAAGAVLSSAALLNVDFPPQFTSAPRATPPQVPVGKPVAFSAAAQAIFNQPMLYAWNFGDGTSTQPAPVADATHTFSAAGLYTVTLTATDPLGLSASASLSEFVFLDARGSGVPEIDPAMDNSFFTDALMAAENLAPVDFSVAGLLLKLNFAQPDSDSLRLSGTLPLMQGSSVKSQRIQFIVGGVGRAFTLTAAGVTVENTAAASGTSLKFDVRNAGGIAPSGRFVLTIQRANLQAFFAADGLSNANLSHARRTVRVSVLLDGVLYDTQRVEVYNARQGKIGVAQ